MQNHTINQHIPRGKLSKRQKYALQNHTQWLLPTNQDTYCFTTIFKREAPIICEIGFGMGQNLLTQAKNHPEYDFIGIDIYAPGIGNTLATIFEQEITNLRLIYQDATLSYKQNIPKESLNQINILFPDPWPKNRHHKRRLIKPEFIHQAGICMKKNGILNIATDWENYAEDIIYNMAQQTTFQKIDPKTDIKYVQKQTTKYEARGQKLGHEITNMLFIKK